MRVFCRSRVTKSLIILLGSISFLTGYQPVEADAKQRHAFIVGIGDYNDKSGLADLATPVNDAQDVKLALEALPQPFEVDIVTDDQAKDKDTFQNAFQIFLSRVSQGDEVIFYFSGHGYNTDRKNYFLLKTAKSDSAFFKDLTPAEAKELDNNDKKIKRYIEFIKNVALSEDEIEKAIADRKPETIVLIADASRSKTDGSKGAALEPQGIILPPRSAPGVYRLYSASEGQISLDSLEPVYRKSGVTDSRTSNDKSKPRRNSLFARVLVSKIRVPGQPFLVMAERIKNAVRKQAKDQLRDQIPDYSQERRDDEYFLWPADSGTEQAAFCQWADADLQNLRIGISLGALGRDYIETQFATLSRCGPFIRQQIRVLRTIEEQGTGSFAGQAIQTVDASQIVDPQQICDAKGASPVDSDRQPISTGIDVQKLALIAAAGGRDRDSNLLEIKSIVEACEQAVAQRPRVARFKFNAARANYALASVTSGLERTVALRRASMLNQEAVDLGYPAAYNNLAVMIQNGEYYKENSNSPEAPDRDAAAKLLQRGADLGHVVAQYNLGMAYLRGDLGLGTTSALTTSTIAEKSREAVAFKYVSAASEKSYVPAMIETALLLHDARGVPRNVDRATELLSSAAYTGSWEAMYWLGWIYRRGYKNNDDDNDPQALSQAILWYARAAEAGHVLSQYNLAEMLERGDGIPAPQPEAAGRYYRLAAYGGSEDAMARLGDLLRDRQIPFRPVADRKPDGGALEIRTLYLAAFSRGNPRAGLQLAKLYRSGFPTEEGSEAIPKDPESAINLLYRTIERVNQADTGSWEANPSIAALAAFEIIAMYDNGEAKRKDGSLLLSDDQIQQLRQDYGDGVKKGFIRVSGIGEAACGKNSYAVENSWIMVWDWDRDDPPTESQLRWLERYYKCSEYEITQAKDKGRREPKPEDTGFSKAFRERIAQQYRAARDDFKKNGAKAKSFYERMADLVSQSGGRRRRRY